VTQVIRSSTNSELQIVVFRSDTTNVDYRLSIGHMLGFLAESVNRKPFQLELKFTVPGVLPIYATHDLAADTSSMLEPGLEASGVGYGPLRSAISNEERMGKQERLDGRVERS
jgi:hypothetical protein